MAGVKRSALEQAGARRWLIAPRWLGLLSVLGVVGPWTAAVARAEPAAPSAVAPILEAGWQRSIQAAQAAKQQYERLRQADPSDPRIDYAYALVQLKQLRYAEAAPPLARVVAADKTNLAAWQLKAWVSLVTKDYAAALADLKRIAELAPADSTPVAPKPAEPPPAQPPAGPEPPPEIPGADTSADARWDDAAEWVGRIFGYLEGPAADGAGALPLATTRRDVAERLGPRRAKLLEQGRADVLREYAEASQDVEQDRDNAEAQAAAEKERQLADLARQVAGAETDLSAAQDHYEHVRAEVADEMNRIGKQQRLILSELQRLEVEAARIRAELAVIDQRVFDLYALADAEKDPARRQWYLNDASRWSLQRGPYLGRLAELDRRAAGLNADAAALQQQAAAAQMRLQQQGAALDQAQKRLVRLRQQSDRVASRRISGTTARVLDGQRRTAAATSYVPLPVSLEEEKRRLSEPP